MFCLCGGGECLQINIEHEVLTLMRSMIMLISTRCNDTCKSDEVTSAFRLSIIPILNGESSAKKSDQLSTLSML